MLTTMLGNMWTTILGVLAGAFYYLKTNGATMPTTKAEWMNLLFAALLAGLGLTSKDASTGSTPH